MTPAPHLLKVNFVHKVEILSHDLKVHSILEIGYEANKSFPFIGLTLWELIAYKASFS